MEHFNEPADPTKDIKNLYESVADIQPENAEMVADSLLNLPIIKGILQTPGNILGYTPTVTSLQKKNSKFQPDLTAAIVTLEKEDTKYYTYVLWKESALTVYHVEFISKDKKDEILNTEENVYMGKWDIEIQK